MISIHTRLSELRQILATSSAKPSGRDRLVENILQSLRVEGYIVRKEDVLASIDRVLAGGADNP